ncbi:MAG: hypothetical protein HWE10_04315 [Gammaproteobacteria bacterium]|nr:hypothetical protein [Gammaproteobacteria bacterium]
MNNETYSLHIIFSPEAWPKAKHMVAKNDRVLLLQDAVVLTQEPLQSTFIEPNEIHHLYARGLDVLARNIKSDPHIEVIDDEQWLELTEHANNVVSW